MLKTRSLSESRARFSGTHISRAPCAPSCHIPRAPRHPLPGVLFTENVIVRQPGERRLCESNSSRATGFRGRGFDAVLEEIGPGQCGENRGHRGPGTKNSVLVSLDDAFSDGAGAREQVFQGLAVALADGVFEGIEIAGERGQHIQYRI